MTRTDTDVLIAGGGFAGLTLAIALRQGLGPAFSVVIADPALDASRPDRRAAGDERASAIVAAARRLFEAIGVWPRIAEQTQPILDMVVTDSRLGDAMRPAFLTFAGDVEPGEPFAHMVENRLLVDALVAKAREVGVELRAAAVTNFSHTPLKDEGRDGGTGDPQNLDVRFADGTALRARLLVAADGARSTIRIAAGIATHGWSYGQSAIVINVAHERDHHGRAEEHFLPAGPFAILPLKGYRSSIVWTESTAEAERIMALPDDAFHAELEQRF
ncbi:MAG: FAD-dependent monooxygenase, partial [Xanthobacteraceae bacterium]